MTRVRPRRAHKWPWGVAAVDLDTGKTCSARFVCLRRHLWWGWCDCGWDCVRHRRRLAARALANHTHLPPNPFKPGSAAGRPGREFRRG